VFDSVKDFNFTVSQLVCNLVTLLISSSYLRTFFGRRALRFMNLTTWKFDNNPPKRGMIGIKLRVEHAEGTL
jgi:hypothetical protein